MQFFKIASYPFGGLGFRSILRNPKILLFSVVSNVLLFFHHYVIIEMVELRFPLLKLQQFSLDFTSVICYFILLDMIPNLLTTDN